MQKDLRTEHAPSTRESESVRRPPSRLRLGLWLFFTFVVLAALIAGLAYFQYVFKPEMIRGFIAKAVPPPASVTGEPAREERWVVEVHSVGTLMATAGIDVASEVPGVVTAINFNNGDTVAANAPLIQLDDAIERADLVSNQANLKQAESDLTRQQELARRNIAAQSTLEAARAKRDSLAATVARSQALIAQKSIRAPFAGRIGIRKVDLGQYVSPGAGLVSLQLLDPIRADFTVPEQDVPKLHPGQVVEITSDAMPDTVFKGTIEALDSRLDPSTRSLTVRASLPNPGLKLLPGMFANVTVLTGEPLPVVTVPRTAITYSLYGDAVYVAEPGGAGTAAAPAAATAPAQQPAASNAAAAAPAAPQLVANRRSVKLGDSRGDRIAILDGIKAGEQVVTSGQIKLQPGAPVRINNAAALEAPAQTPLQ